MRKNIILFLLLVISVTSFSQQTTKPAPLSKADYLNKSQHQSTAAWIFLGGGLALTSAGAIIGINGAAHDLVGIFAGQNTNKAGTGAVIFYTGLACMVGSIPFFIASSRNKRNAGNISASFKFESGSFVRQSARIQSKYPAIALKINL